eukprot:350989-Chlamydomonas_euryale.AAC.6
MERHAPRMLKAHGGTISASTSWVNQVKASCGTACAEGQHKQDKGQPEKTAKAASNEGASTTTGLRHGRPPGSKNKPRIGHAVMQKAKAQAKAKA